MNYNYGAKTRTKDEHFRVLTPSTLCPIMQYYRTGNTHDGRGGFGPQTSQKRRDGVPSGMLARAMGSVRAFNLVVSNIPGPQQPFYLSGVRMLEVYPVVPPNPTNQGLTIGILSYDGQVCLGLLADRDLDPSLATAAAGLTDALAELGAAAGG